MVNFQCISGLSPADVMIVTCTVEGSWRPDPQLLNCSSTTEGTNTNLVLLLKVQVAVAFK